MAARRVRVLKRMLVGNLGRIGNDRELVKRLVSNNPRISPERERFFAERKGEMEAGRLSKADFIEELATMKKEGEGQRPKKRFRGGTNLRENVSDNIRRHKEELKILKKHK